MAKLDACYGSREARRFMSVDDCDIPKAEQLVSGRFGDLGRRCGAQRRGGVIMRHLILKLESPMMSFGGETIDNLGVIRPFPAASMLTGLFANALGWRRTERERHQRLQDRLVFAARIDREPATGVRMTDYQTVKMADTVDLYVQNNRWVIGWTTRGTPETRAGALGATGSGTFHSISAGAITTPICALPWHSAVATW